VGKCVILIRESLSDNPDIHISFEDSSEDEYSDSEGDEEDMITEDLDQEEEDLETDSVNHD